MVKCKKSVPKALTYKRKLQNDKSYLSKMAQMVTFITQKVHSGCDFDTHNTLFTVKRNGLGHFWHVHFVIWELGRPGFPPET